MIVFKKILAWLTGVFAVVFVLILLALLMSPLWLNQELVKKTLVDAISQQLGGSLQYKKIEILLLPKPHLVLHRSRFQLNENVEGTIASIGVFPKIIPLIDGQINIAHVRVENPDIILTPDSGPSSWQMDPRYVFKPLVRTLSGIFSHPVIKSDSTFEFKSGRLRIAGSQHAHQFRQIEAKIRYSLFSGLSYAISCRSSLWDHLALKGRLRLNTARGNGQVKCVNLRPQAILNQSAVGRHVHTTDGRMDIDLRFSTTSPSDLNVEAKGTVPYWELQKGIDKTVIKVKRFNTVLHLTPDHLAVSLANLDVKEPSVQLSGNFVLDRTRSDVRLDLSCTGIDASAIRENALILAGQVSTVKELFNIIQSGQVPTLRLNAHGRSLNELTEISNYLIKGRMLQGRIYIPGPALDLDDVTGDVVIADGVLQGSGLRARLGNSSGRDGRLTLGLKSIAEPFSLDILVDADLSQLPGVLAEQIPNREFHREMQDLNILSGRASGRMILAQSEGEVRPLVQVFDAEFLADYQRIPYPVKLRIASMHYQNSRIYFEVPEAMVGDSILSNLTVAVDWRKSTFIDISTEAAELEIQQAYACLTRALPRNRLDQTLLIQGGHASINSLRIQGPADSYVKWEMSMRGTLHEVPLTWRPGNESITIKKSAFHIQENGLDPEIDSEIIIHQTDLQWGQSQIGVGGRIAITGHRIRLDIDATADGLDAAQFESFDGKTSNDGWLKRLTGQLRIAADRFTYGDWSWDDIHADITLVPHQTTVQVSRASLCGMSTTGEITIGPDSIQVAVFPIATDMSVSPVMTCLFDRKDIITGKFNLSGQLHTKIHATDLARDLTGSLAAVAEEGRIYRYTALSKILALINITELFKGKMPDLAQKGFAYKSLTGKGDLRNGELMVSEMIIDGASMTIVARGKYHLLTRKLRFTVLVAPFKSIDSIIQNLPVTSLMFGNTLVSFPFLIKGTPDNFDVASIGPSAVEPELSNILNRKLKGPVQIYNPEKLHRSRNFDR